MAKAVDCPCGQTLRGETDDELVTNVEAHVRSDHPDMVATMTRDKILEMAHDACAFRAKAVLSRGRSRARAPAGPGARRGPPHQYACG